jgi:[acyl-carrier-protein] S-malonyltransferase
MKDAAEGLAEYLEGVAITLPETSVISNVLGREAGGTDEIRRTLADQVTHSVRWHESMKYLVTKCVNVFVECGCGKVLRGLLRRTAPEAVAVGVEDADSLDVTLTTLSGIL